MAPERPEDKDSVDMGEWRSIDYESKLDKEIQLLEESPLSEVNRDLILRYMNWRLANSVSYARTQREVVSLRLLCQKFGADLSNMGEDALFDVLAGVRRAGYKLNTINEYKTGLKLFLKFQGKEELASQVSCKEPENNDLTRDDLLTVEEVLKLVETAMNNRDKAIIMCHLDLGCRPEELLTLTYGSFIRDSWGIKVELERSKTYTRSPHLSFSLPYVCRWLEDHPHKNPDAPAWIDFHKLSRGHVSPIDNDAYRRLIDRLFRRAGLDRRKKFTPYNFRHTSLTMWSMILTEQALAKRSGHVPGSKSLKRYTKLVDRDTDKKILGELGMITEQESQSDVRKLQTLNAEYAKNTMNHKENTAGNASQT